jgi:hypothetical protein
MRSLAIALALTLQLPALSFDALNVPAASLPEGCTLAPVSAPIVGGPSFPTNPWTGSTPAQMSLVRQAITVRQLDSRPVPDAIWIERRVLSADSGLHGVRELEGVVEAYRAAYVTPYRAPVTVSSVRFSDEKHAADVGAPFMESQVPKWFRKGTVVATIAGPVESPCFEAVRNHLQRLFK